MARIKKRGLDYFPMNTDFLQSRSVRRLLKREGDAALAALLGALSIIYDDEGYFVRLDDDLCEDLSDGLFSLEAADVRRVLQTAVEVGLFDEGMFREHGILTSEEIQRQFLFIKRPRKRALIDERYCLLPPDEEEENAAAPADGEGTKVQDLGTKSTQIVQKTPENVDFTPQSTQSKEKESIEKQSKADLLPNGSPQTGGTPAAGRMPAGEEGDVGVKKPGGAPYEWTHDAIGRLVPPPDGLPRNLDGRIEVLVPVLDPEIAARIKATLDLQLADNMQCWEMQSDGRYVRVKAPARTRKVNSQMILAEHYGYAS